MFVQVQFNTCCRIVSFHLASCSKVEKLSCARIKKTTAPLLFPVFNVYWLFNKTQVITQNTQLHNTLKTWKTQIVSKIDVSQPEGCSLQRVRTRGAGTTLWQAPRLKTKLSSLLCRGSVKNVYHEAKNTKLKLQDQVDWISWRKWYSSSSTSMSSMRLNVKKEKSTQRKWQQNKKITWRKWQKRKSHLEKVATAAGAAPQLLPIEKSTDSCPDQDHQWKYKRSELKIWFWKTGFGLETNLSCHQLFLHSTLYLYQFDQMIDEISIELIWTNAFDLGLIVHLTM